MSKSKVTQMEISNEGLDLRLDQIVVAPEDNTRMPGESDPHVKTLAESIARFGQMQPVLVALVPGEADKFRLVVGFRRYAAIQSLNRRKGEDTLIRASIVEVDDTKAGRLHAFTANLHENLDREAYTPIDNLHAIEKFKADFGLNQKQIAEEFGKSPAWVTSILKLAKLDEATRHEVHTGKISVDAALVLADMDDTARAEVVKEATETTKQAKAAGRTGKAAGSASASAVRKAAAKKRAEKAAQPAQPATRKAGKEVKKAGRPKAVRMVPSMKEFREFLEENLGPTTDEPVHHFMEYLIEVSYGRADMADITKASADTVALVKNPKAKTQWSIGFGGGDTVKKAAVSMKGKATGGKTTSTVKPTAAAAAAAIVSVKSPARKGKK